MIIHKHNIEFFVDDSTKSASWWENLDSWEGFIFKCIDKCLNKENTFIDIGAWNGVISLYASRICNKVYSFEPDVINYNDLCKNIVINNFQNIYAENIAISNIDGQQYLYNNDEWGTSMSTLLDNDSHSNDKMLVNVNKLETLIKKYNIDNVGLIKIDVEGGEKLIIPDAIDVLNELKTSIHLSLHWNSLSYNEIDNILKLLSETYDFFDWKDECVTSEFIKNTNLSQIFLQNK